ncbi:MAG: SDR family oxidoreductase [Minisyncoccia bacterium]
MKNKAKEMKVLVTGGAGFIGSNLVDALIAEGHQVTVIDNLFTGKKSQVNRKAKFVRADICEPKKIKPYFKNIDWVFHLAAIARIQPSIKDPVPTIYNNIIGTLNVLLAARDAKVKRVIYSASSSSYGDQQTLPLHEKMSPRFKSPYSLSKYVGEELCRLFSNLYGLKTVSLRYFNVYGSRQLLTGAYATVIGIFLDQIRAGKSLTIVGDGKGERDFTHINDIVRANILAAKSDKIGQGELINIGTGKNYSVNKVAEMILGLSKKPTGAVNIPARPGETRRTLADNSKARELLGWKPTISLEEGLKMLK